MKILKRIYSIYGTIVFFLVFLLMFPAFIIVIQKRKWHKIGLMLNRIWAWAFFTFTFIPVKFHYHFKPDKKKKYVFCSNHFSYLDIVLLGLLPNTPKFIGKSSIAKVPIFGYMYKKLHITVDRNNARSKYDAVIKSEKAVDEGHSVVIFPEGGITSKNIPDISKFKDGAFRVAIEKQIPLVPVTIPYNWIILPDDGKFHFTWHKEVAIVHQPIETKGLTLDNLDEIKEKTYTIISEELKKWNR